VRELISNLIFKFDITVNEDANAKQPIKEVVRKELSSKLRQKLAAFSGDLIKGMPFNIEYINKMHHDLLTCDFADDSPWC
jgi:hypothetical protein